MSKLRLARSESNKVIAGVCAGLADYLDVDVALVRLAFVVLGMASGFGIPIYIALAVIAPKESQIDESDYYPTERLKGDEVRARSNARFFAGLLIVLGVYFLLENVGVDFDFLLPLLLIVGGIWLVMRRR